MMVATPRRADVGESSDLNHPRLPERGVGGGGIKNFENTACQHFSRGNESNQ
jgi:hypothetical protein